jgi:imidazolonepropionase-like amidohydrolase
MNRLLLFAKRLLDCETLKPIEDGTILIENGIIVGVGHKSEFSGLSDHSIVDCGEQTLMPGLNDAHNHLSLDSSLENYLEKMTDTIPALSIRAAKAINEDLRSGVTTIRCIGGQGIHRHRVR